MNETTMEFETKKSLYDVLLQFIRLLELKHHFSSYTFLFDDTIYSDMDNYCEFASIAFFPTMAYWSTCVEPNAKSDIHTCWMKVDMYWYFMWKKLLAIEWHSLNIVNTEHAIEQSSF